MGTPETEIKKEIASARADFEREAAALETHTKSWAEEHTGTLIIGVLVGAILGAYAEHVLKL